MNKLKVGLLLHGNDHTIEKYSQVLSLLDEMKKDDRFEIYLVIDKTTSDKVKPLLDSNYAKVVSLSEDLVISNNRLDCMLIITPYPPHPDPHYRKWKTKIIYKEYGTTGIDLGYKNIWKIDAVYKFSDMIITDSYHNKMELAEILGKDKAVVGSPAYDYKFKYKVEPYNDGLKHVLWTPHHSIYSNKTYDGIFGGRYSTWLSYRDDIPLLVKYYPIKLHIKFHPNLERRYKQYCKENHLKNDFTQYIDKISQYPNVEIVGNEDYYPLFLKSDAMLNDSISFLQEYLPTGKPMMVLYDKDRASYNEYGESLIDKCYYRGYSITDIEYFIKNTVLGNYDSESKKNNRKEIISDYYIDPTKPNSQALLDIIYNKYKEE